jgi:hypothetical protein
MLRLPKRLFWLALGLFTLLPGAAAAAGRVLPFITDDYDRAVAEARARKVPLFVEAWAPW